MTGGPPHINPFGGLGHGGHWQALTQDPRHPDAAANQRAGAVGDALRAQAAYQAQQTHLARQGLTPGYVALGQAALGGAWPASVLEETPPKPDDEFAVGEIIAPRAWRLKHGLLCSMMADHVWQPHDVVGGEMKWGSMTGVHAFKTTEHCLEEYRSYNWMTPEPYVYGTVALWGVVDEYEFGYRAEKAAIHSIDVIATGRPDVERVKSRWPFGTRKCTAKRDAYDELLYTLQERYGVLPIVEAGI